MTDTRTYAPVKSPEMAKANLVPADGTNAASAPAQVVVAVTPTQVRRPWRSTVRSVFQFAVGLATLLPFIAAGVYEDLDSAPIVVGQVLAVAGAVTRVMALPQVEDFLRKFLPFLSAAPTQ